MKKIICFVIILMLALTACSVNDAEIKTPEENHLSTEEPTVSTEDENLSAEDEDLSTEEKRHPFTARAEQELLSRINDFTDGFYPLRDKGLEISAENIEVLDDIFFSYDLHIRNEHGKEAVIRVTGAYQKNGDMESCGFSFIDENTIAFYGLEYAAFIDAKTLEVTEVTPDLSDLGKEVWINGLTGYGEGFAIAATPMGEIGYGPDAEYETFFLSFDKNGNRTEKIKMANDWKKVNRYYNLPHFTRDMTIFETNEGRMLASYGMDNLDTGISYGYYKIAEFGNDERKVVIYRYSDGETGEHIDNLAVLFENGASVSSMNIGGGTFFFSEDSMNGGTVSADGKATVKDDFYGRTIELDFVKKTCEFNYKIEEKHLSELLIERSDGKYSLWSASFTSGGDANNFSIVLKNNETGDLALLGTGGGMYGGGGRCGFLENGNVYLTDYGVFEIYDPETAKLIFTAAENFPLGKLSDGTYRFLLAFCEDEKGGYAAAYFETGVGGIEWDYNDITHPDGKFHSELANNYKIGFLDAKGKLIESYDTGCGVWYDGFGIQGVSIIYSKEKITLKISHTKGNDGFIGEFDMEEKTFNIFY